MSTLLEVGTERLKMLEEQIRSEQSLFENAEQLAERRKKSVAKRKAEYDQLAAEIACFRRMGAGRD